MSEREKTGGLSQKERSELLAEVLGMACEVVRDGDRDIIDNLKLNIKAFRHCIEVKRKARGAGQECGDTGHAQTGTSFPKARKAGTARRDVFVNKTLLYERIFEHLDKAENAAVWVDRWAKDLQKESVNMDPDAENLLRYIIRNASDGSSAIKNIKTFLKTYHLQRNPYYLSEDGRRECLIVIRGGLHEETQPNSLLTPAFRGFLKRHREERQEP